MNRRLFLGATAVSFGLVTSPAWIRQAFAGEPSSKTLVFDAYRRARRAGQPLLVFIIPVDPGERWRRGHVLGSFITFATDAQLAPLAHCEVVCATAAHVHELVPNAPAGDSTAWFDIVDPGPASATFQLYVFPGDAVPQASDTIDVQVQERIDAASAANGITVIDAAGSHKIMP